MGSVASCRDDRRKRSYESGYNAFSHFIKEITLAISPRYEYFCEVYESRPRDIASFLKEVHG